MYIWSTNGANGSLCWKKATKEKVDVANITIEERLKLRIIDGDQIGISNDLLEGMKNHTPLIIINDILLDGMKVVGELFGSGQMQLPFVLQSAETMKTAVAFLEKYMEKEDTTTKGTIVLATVKGDVHDIGKNLVDIILTNNGYTVINLGIKVAVDLMLDSAEKNKAQAIGMSGLLVKSTLIMKENLELMKGRGITIPVILGGAALTRRYVESDLRSIYGENVGYAADAFDGLHFMENISAGKSILNIGSNNIENEVSVKRKLIDRETLFIDIADEIDTIDIKSIFDFTFNDDILFVVKLNEGIVGFVSLKYIENDIKEITNIKLYDEQKNSLIDVINALKLTLNNDESLLINIPLDDKLYHRVYKAFGFTNVENLTDNGNITSLIYKKNNTNKLLENKIVLKVIPDYQNINPPFLGVNIIEDIRIEKVFEYINEVALIRGQWLFKKGSKTNEDYKNELDKIVYPKLDELKLLAKREKLIEPKCVYGYFPCNSDGNSLIIYKPKNISTNQLHSKWDLNLNSGIENFEEYCKFDFPRQNGERELCISDYFKPKSLNEFDVVSFQIVTVGQKASEYTAKLFQDGNFSNYLYFHGLSVECAEALAEYMHRTTRIELGINHNDATDVRKLFAQGYQGSRYSFGYPACPNLEDQSKIFDLLKPERIGVSLSEEFMLEPEQSTSAIIVHNSLAKYFNV